MLRNFIHVAPEATAQDARQLMRSARIRHLPVVSNGVLLGLLSYRDLLEFALRQAERDPGALDALRASTVAALMTADPVAATPSSTLEEAALRMLRHRVGCLPIVDGPDPARALVVGLLTESDVIRAALRARPA